MRYITTIIIGAGQSGLAMSKHLTDRSIDHVLLERGGVANSWQTERWDSLRLLTPNWQSRLPGYAYEGNDPNGYMRVTEVVGYLKRYAEVSGAPVQAHTKVTRVRQSDTGYEVTTDQGMWRCQTLVVASGACNIATVPAVAGGLLPGIASLTPMQYRNPESLPDGGVLIVGASATGVQLAREIRASGRSVMLAAGEHVRVPRIYRGRDIKWWMDAMGAMDLRYDAIDDIDRARRLPSLQLIGTPERENIDLNGLRKAGVEIVGRVAGMRDGKLQFSASLPNHCALADLKMNRLLTSIDAWIFATEQQDRFPASHRFEPTEIDPQTRTRTRFECWKHQNGDLGHRISPRLFLARCSRSLIARGGSVTTVVSWRRPGCTSWACRSCADANRPSSTEPRTMPRTLPRTLLSACAAWPRNGDVR